MVPKKPRPRNPWWDTLVEVMGYEPAPGPESSKWGKCVKFLRFDVEATPEQIRQRAAAYPLHFGEDCAFTPTALVSHWAELGTPSKRQPTSQHPRQPNREEPKHFSRMLGADGKPMATTGGAQ